MPQFLSDEPTLLDQLDRAELVRRIGDVVAGCRAPAVFGLHGDWGAGKTSFLHALHFYLTGDCPQCPHEGDLRAFRGLVNHGTKPLWPGWKEKRNVAVVWFEAWRYQNETAPIVALLHEIRAQLPLAAKSAEAARKWFSVGIKSVLLGLDEVTKWIGFQAGKLVEQTEKQHSQWQKDHLAERLPSHTLREFLEKAFKALLPSTDDARLVVLIDDLDRCDSQAAYKLLEGIKIYLNLPNCVFVLGVNQAVIEESLASQIKTGSDHRFQAREYLEKICKNFWYLPHPDSTDLGKLLIAYLNQARDQKLDGANAIPSEYVGIIASEVEKARCLPANPRKVKAFANTLARFLSRPGWNVEDQEDVRQINLKLCVLLAYLYQFHPDMYRLVESDPEFFGQLENWCYQIILSEDKKEKAHNVFDRVERVSIPTPNANAGPGSPPNFVKAFVDPARGNVFRAQQLVIELRGLIQNDRLKDCVLR